MTAGTGTKGRATPVRAWTTLLLHALAIWALCGATMGIGMNVASMDTALWIHLVAAPVFSWAVSSLYFRRYGDTTALVTALAVVGSIIFLDFFLVALVINRSLDMFRSVRGTWLPFLLIFVAAYAAGVTAGHGKDAD
jgi:hypothetical protein